MNTAELFHPPASMAVRIHAEADGVGGKAVATAGVARLVRDVGAAADRSDAVIDAEARGVAENWFPR